MAPVYPKFDVTQSGHLQVSSLHSIYWEDCGTPTGVPIVYLHGGPGGGIDETDRQYFDPAHYRSVLFDQRGSGKSTPHASLEENTTWHLVADIEKLREHLKIDKWLVFGGPGARPWRWQLLWYYQHGANFIFPDYFEAYKNAIPEAERGDLMQAYYKRLTNDDDEDEQLKCADAWSRWEVSTSKLIVDPAYIAKADDPEWALAFARIECHYFVNGGWMRDGQLVDDAHKIKHLPITIVQGRYDVVCPAKTSWDLYQALGGAANTNVDYVIVGDAGHSARETTIEGALMKAVEKYKSIKQ
ncbi:proline iminopeptidase [Apiospora saccharicola]